MGLEAATYVNQLVGTNPLADDQVAQGDDHIRLIKAVLLATFPSVAGAITASPTELNILDGITAGGVIPTGVAKFFYMAAAPTGWTRDATVDDKALRVVSGAGTGTGGTWVVSGIAADSHVLTEAELAAHTHTTVANADHTHTFTVYSTGVGGSYPRSGTVDDYSGPTTSSGTHTHTLTNTGGGLGHTHTVTSDGVWRPAYYDVIRCTKN